MSDQILKLLAEIKIRPDEIKVPKGDLGQPAISTGLQIAFMLAGAIAVIIVIIAGFQYVISQGNPQSTAKAKDTIIYALVGLVVCATGYGIVTFVLGRL